MQTHIFLFISLHFWFSSDRKFLSQTEVLTWCSSSQVSFWRDLTLLRYPRLLSSWRSGGSNSVRGWEAPLPPEPAGQEGTDGDRDPSAPGRNPPRSLYQPRQAGATLGWLLLNWMSIPETAKDEKSKRKRRFEFYCEFFCILLTQNRPWVHLLVFETSHQYDFLPEVCCERIQLHCDEFASRWQQTQQADGAVATVRPQLQH